MNNQLIHLIDSKSQKRWDKSYAITKNETLWGNASVPYMKKAIKYFKNKQGTFYLDLPCGDGRNIIPLSQNLPVVVGGDTSKNALHLTEKRISNYNISNCLLVHSDIFRTNFLDNQFDGIFCWDILGHLVKVNEAIKELLRIIKPQGRLIGSLFSIGDSTRGENMKKVGYEEYVFDKKYYFKYYNRSDVLSLLENLAAKQINLETTTWKEPPHEGYREYPHEHESWVFVIEKL